MQLTVGPCLDLGAVVRYPTMVQRYGGEHTERLQRCGGELCVQVKESSGVVWRRSPLTGIRVRVEELPHQGRPAVSLD